MSFLEVPLVEGSNLTGKIPIPKLGRELTGNAQVGRSFIIMKLLLPKYGDKRFYWNPLSLPEIKEAEEFYLNCIQEGLTPFAVNDNGTQGEIMPTFEPGAGAAVFQKIAEENKTIAMMPIKQVAGG